MPPQSSPSLEQPFEGLHATEPTRLPFGPNLQVRSFLLECPRGNLLVYNAPGITAAASEIGELGGATRLLVNHAHEGMYEAPEIQVPVFVHERDRDELAHSLPVEGTFAERQMIDDDVEIIPIPGHTPGTTAFIWDNGSHRFLFTGDTLTSESGQWRAAVLGSSDRAAYVDSLALIRELDFDVLVPWAAVEGERYLDLVTRSEIEDHIDELVARVRAGATH